MPDVAAEAVIVRPARELFIADTSETPGVVLKARWDDESKEWIGPFKPYPPPPRPVASPALRDLGVGDIAFDREGMGYVCSGVDGHAPKTDGRTVVGGWNHQPPPIRNVGFDRSGRVLYYSVVRTPQVNAPLEGGEIFAWDPKDFRVWTKYEPQNPELVSDWWGSFAFHGDTLYLNTLKAPATVYRIDDGEPVPVYRSEDEPIHGMAFDPWGNLYFTNGGAKVFRVREFRERELILEAPGKKLRGLAFLQAAERGTGSISGRVTGDPGRRRLLRVIVVGPNWSLRDGLGSSPNGVGPLRADGTFEITGLPPGKYWVWMDSKADGVIVEPNGREVTVGYGATTRVDFRVR